MLCGRRESARRCHTRKVRGYGFRSRRRAPSRNDIMPAIKPDRVLADLTKLRTFGTYKTGVHRPTYSADDIASRQWFADQCAAAGLETTIDGIGNILGKSTATGRKMLSGSHLESQNHAGWLDGALGCVYAPEAARAIHAA